MSEETEVNIYQLPAKVLNQLKSITEETLLELTEQDIPCKKVYDAFHKFKDKVGNWATISEKVFYESIM